jgi:hypothetical protein
MDFNKVLEILPPLKEKKDANVAAIVGFLFGGIGLAIYLRSVADLFVAILVCLVVLSLCTAVGELGMLGIPVLAAVYGIVRVQDSNRRISQN